MSYEAIVVERRPDRFAVFVIATIFFIMCFMNFYDFIFYGETEKLKEAAFNCLFFLPFGIVFLLVLSDKKEYLADIVLDNSEVRLVYRSLNKITRVKTIQKSDIGKFILNTEINLSAGRNSTTVADYKIFIKSREERLLFDYSFTIRSSSASNFVYRILKASYAIPNFNLIVKSNSEREKAEIEHFRKTGKRLAFYPKEDVSGIFILILFIIAAVVILMNSLRL